MAASLAGGEGIEAAELAIRAGLTRLGRGVLEDLLAADAQPGQLARAGQGMPAHAYARAEYEEAQPEILYAGQNAAHIACASLSRRS